MTIQLKATLDAEYDRGRQETLETVQDWLALRREARIKAMTSSNSELRKRRWTEVSIIDDLARHVEYLRGMRRHPEDDETQRF